MNNTEDFVSKVLETSRNEGYKQAILDALKYIKAEQEIRQEPCSDMVELVNHLYNKINSKD